MSCLIINFYVFMHLSIYFHIYCKMHSFIIFSHIYLFPYLCPGDFVDILTYVSKSTYSILHYIVITAVCWNDVWLISWPNLDLNEFVFWSCAVFGRRTYLVPPLQYSFTIAWRLYFRLLYTLLCPLGLKLLPKYLDIFGCSKQRTVWELQDLF